MIKFSKNLEVEHLRMSSPRGVLSISMVRVIGIIEGKMGLAEVHSPLARNSYEKAHFSESSSCGGRERPQLWQGHFMYLCNATSSLASMEYPIKDETI